VSAFLAGFAIAAALNWLRWRHIDSVWWLVSSVPDIVQVSIETVWDAW
jgi:hypothetical protein